MLSHRKQLSKWYCGQLSLKYFSTRLSLSTVELILKLLKVRSTVNVKKIVHWDMTKITRARAGAFPNVNVPSKSKDEVAAHSRFPDE